MCFCKAHIRYVYTLFSSRYVETLKLKEKIPLRFKTPSCHKHVWKCSKWSVKTPLKTPGRDGVWLSPPYHHHIPHYDIIYYIKLYYVNMFLIFASLLLPCHFVSESFDILIDRISLYLYLFISLSVFI